MNKTKWFSANTKPTLKGVYEVDDGLVPEEGWFAYWDGKKFGYRNCGGPGDAFETKDCHTCLPERVKWRGLAQDPNAA